MKFQRKDFTSLLMSTLGVICSFFMLANLTFIIIETWLIETVLLGFMIILGIYYNPLSRTWWGRSVDLFLMLVEVVCAGYVVLNLERLIYFGQTFPSALDLVVFTAGILILLELTRRTVGWVLPVVAVVCIVYAFFGQHIGGLWGHPGFSFSRITGHIYSENGIFTIPMRVVVRYIYLFLLFGAFLSFSGVGEVIISFANALAGGTRGGPAKVAIIASALFGSISGSALANVGTTGAFTIPMMKRIGYTPHFAAAVEAVASTGGQWMPPVMAGTAFILAEYVELPYREVMIAAFVPACLYYLCLGLQIDLEAIKMRLQGLRPEETPRLAQVMKRGGYLFLPVLVLVFDLLILNHSVIHAALYSIASCVLVSWVRPETRMGLISILRALNAGARSSIVVTLSCATAGVIIGVLNLTGLGVRLGSLMVKLSQGNALMMLLFTGIVALILGMGMPTTGAYIICAAIMAPALVMIGMPVFPVHLFILYYAVINCITPPVALAAYAAASLARASPMRTAITATRLGIVAYFVPILFVYNKELLLIGSTLNIIESIFFAIIGVAVLSMSLNGRFYSYGITWAVWQRLVLLIAAGLMFMPATAYRLTGLSFLAIAALSNRNLLRWASSTLKVTRAAVPE